MTRTRNLIVGAIIVAVLIGGYYWYFGHKWW
jgi:hypothetical protein